MLKVIICIGSSCHLKGSRQVVEQLQNLITENKIEEKVELSGTFCMGKCQSGVCCSIDEKFFSLTPENTKDFFDNEIITRIQNN